MDILKIKDLNVTYLSNDKKIKAVNNLSLNIEENSSYGIVGESGSGKSTLAMAILRLLPRESLVSGEILYRDKDLLKLDMEELNKLRWTKLSVVFQKAMNSLSPVHKIGTQFVDIYRVHRADESTAKIKKRCLELFEMVNLTDRVFDSYPHELSGGMMQRVSIALSILLNPEILILDESTTALDVITERQILDNIIEIEEKIDLTRIMITHDISVVATSCENIVVMYAGFLLEHGKVEDVLVNPKHPYTIGLLNSYPSIDSDKKYIEGIEGSLPDLSADIESCIYYDRCERRKAICKEKMPELKKYKNSMVACYFPGGRKND